MAIEDQRTAADALLWVSNIVSSVLIIFMTKLLMQSYRFLYSTTISGCHFLSCSLALWGAGMAGFTEPGPPVPAKHSVAYALVGAVSIATANFSLMWNSLGFYQLAKLFLAPAVCALEVQLLGRLVTFPLVVCIGVVLAGVGIITVNDLTVQGPGFLMALLFVGSTALQQVMCGRLQAMHKVAPHQLLAATAPLQGGLLLVAGPVIDWLATGKWVHQWEVNVPGLEMLGVSCAVAVAVNLTQFMLLGRFTATTFQVIGQSKMVLVLLGGWLVFREVIGMREAGGIVIAVVGMIGYGLVAAQTPLQPAGVLGAPTIRAPFMSPQSAAAGAGGEQPGSPGTPTTHANSSKA
uniref:Sugar phosphate transporter domain-containing protein n=1 Tax=Chlamydomonas leiostraca TaxID=1034604 RepID=A0A7S0WV11_9CHLO|mmetsp:Transcript_3018/g.7503  ORF Transcript_3018/g.7503 Transcript_3018/m.7503 type:complete len:349 (+) Transcript_3018:203-1249(+)|eukprot:CAMPEP_0202860348 /NCGR_PEP_ID=MMETSP1391-20130828/2091_1 /ASSEMBLY_ACC=CAM_ASM_000867 /TAXON_ID=1034604 /ORGANISM="Chlamydomonas leiostraca, Strain SAG 11-49" /LENGTH=348 /DNA_ID=CAMNT_0049539503 /DNA_START=124 /DNA_END=1170 /DNA_ORIENTATION=+